MEIDLRALVIIYLNSLLQSVQIYTIFEHLYSILYNFSV